MANQNKAIGSFDIIRKLVRNLYLEGFNNYLETESLGKSSRAFTNNLNSIRTFLDERFLSAKTNTKKKSNPVISFNTRDETENPLFALWKTENSIATNLSFDFAIMDILDDNPEGIGWFSLSSDSDSNKHDGLLSNYVSKGIDKKGVKSKLEKLADAGVIQFFDNGKKIRKTDTRNLKKLLSSKEVKQAIQFASETSPLGVIGSYILDNLKTINNDTFETPIHYKHHFIFNSIDYEIMFILMEAITHKHIVEIETERNGLRIIVPLKIFISTQTGRTYIIFWDTKANHFFSENLELILTAKETESCSNYDELKSRLLQLEPNMWGVSFKKEGSTSLEHVRFVIEYHDYPKNNEKTYIPARIQREALAGKVKEIDDEHSEFIADLLDANEIRPWIRSFYGRITEIECPYTDFIKEDVSLMTEGTHRTSQQATAAETKPDEYVPKNTLENTPLFHPLYSTYYLVVKNLLKTYVNNNKTPLSSSQVNDIIEKTAFIDAPGDLFDIINNTSEVTTIFKYTPNGVTSPVKHIPDFPLSTIELRFLAAILQDHRITMFMNNETEKSLKSELEGVVPLWTSEDVKYFDQNKDADAFENTEYIKRFQTLLNAINNKNSIRLVYGRKENSDIFTPTHMNYSQKDNTFRLFVKEFKYPINLENIKSYEITDQKPSKPEESSKYATLKVEIFDDTPTKYHFNRAIRQFSYFKKTCQKTEEANTYQMTVDYDYSDQSDIIIRVLMFGPQMKVLGPDEVVENIKSRIQKQVDIFKTTRH